MREYWKKLETNPRFFTFFWGALGSLAIWLIVEHSGTFLLYLGANVLGFLKDYIDSKFAQAAILQNTAYSYFILSLIFIVVVVGWKEISSKMSFKLKEEKVNNEEKQTPKWAPYLIRFIKLLVWIYLLLALLLLAGESIVLNSTSNFKQYMRIVAPYITDQEEEVIFSEWSQMDSLDDYINIYKKLDALGKEHKLELKRNQHY